MNKSFWLAKAAKFLVIASLVVALATYAVQALWNWLIPQVFHGPSLGYWQALGLLVLVRLLTGGFGRGPQGGWAGRQAWKRKMQQKLNHLSPEEREKFRQKMRSFCTADLADKTDTPGAV